ncbi:lin-9 [Anaeramoeba ignava]|uniref:Lin-9 n=1 Tax=Anaeramoeba ignava TaxID=1746090 RepID=A0A9Q0L8G2_ANAIG|nr:lin-9 [Anaeramoeba ignava]
MIQLDSIWTEEEIRIFFREYIQNRSNCDEIATKLTRKTKEMIRNFFLTFHHYLNTSGSNEEDLILIFKDYTDQIQIENFSQANLVYDFANKLSQEFVYSQEAKSIVNHPLYSKTGNQLEKIDVRRFSILEWFYPDIDAPFFHQNILLSLSKSFLSFNFSQFEKLTKIDWRNIRRNLGVPKRFSKNFVEHEKKVLESHRDTIRKHIITNKKSLIRDFYEKTGFLVMFRDMKLLKINMGTVLKTEFNSNSIKYLCKFPNPPNQTEWIKDIDVMSVKKITHRIWFDSLNPELLFQLKELLSGIDTKSYHKNQMEKNQKIESIEEKNFHQKNSTEKK